MAKTAKKVKQKRTTTKYKPEYCRMILEYFDPELHPATRDVEVTIQTRGGGSLTKTELQANPPRHLGAFARSIGVSVSATLNEWSAVHPEFKEALSSVKEMIRERLIDCGVTGVWNAQFAKFFAVNETDMRDKTAVDVTNELRATAPTVSVYVREVPEVPEKQEKSGG